jgi:AraC-like DNA-binding protein
VSHEPTEVLWTGNLATPRRTVLGVFGVLDRSEIPLEEAAGFLRSCGLPPIALEEPDIPITREQQLVCMGRLLDHLDPALSIPHHALEVGLGVHITTFGILGLSLMYAGSLRECLRVITSYAEMSWGHSRLLVAREGDQIFESFVHVPGASVGNEEALRRYCLTVDLTASIKMTADLFGPTQRPTAVWLPYPAPHDHRAITKRLGCPVRFDAPEARLYFREDLWSATPLLANPFVFRSFEKQTAQLARRLRSEVPLEEQVRRLLWMSSPPPDRDTVAAMLAMSPRTLARKLAADGTGYGELQREVRLARAREYLRNRTLHVAEIADRLGFSDAAAFSRAFRHWTGETPSAWREREAKPSR